MLSYSSRDEIFEELERNNPATRREIMDFLKSKEGGSHTPTQVINMKNGPRADLTWEMMQKAGAGGGAKKGATGTAKAVAGKTGATTTKAAPAATTTVKKGATGTKKAEAEPEEEPEGVSEEADTPPAASVDLSEVTERLDALDAKLGEMQEAIGQLNELIRSLGLLVTDTHFLTRVNAAVAGFLGDVEDLKEEHYQQLAIAVEDDSGN